MRGQEPLLEVKDLRAYYVTKRGIVRAVDNVSFDIMPGECVGLLGESGCGKSSLALAIMQLFDRVAKFAAGTSGARAALDRYLESQEQGGPVRHGVQGSIIFRGRDLTTLPEEELVRVRGREISLIPQGMTRALNPQFSVGMQTGEPVAIRETQVRLKELREKVLQYLNLVHIPDAGTRFVLDPGSFSGGEAQRILIAMALINGPYLVIADEPTSALDMTVQRQIMNVLQMVKEEFDVSLLIISHDAGVIAELADRVAVMYAGRIMEYGDAVQMFHEPGHPYTQGLMASFPTIVMMQMQAGKKRPRLRGIPGDPPDLTDIPSGCPFHPRCQFAQDRCREEIPEYREVGPRHWVMCHRYEELQSNGP